MSLLSAIELLDTPVKGYEELGQTAAKALYPAKKTSTNLGRAAEAIQRAGEKWHINPAYLWGIYGTETSYGSRIAVSSTGARGPFQFEPATAKQYGYPLGVNELGITDWGAFQRQADAAAHFLYNHMQGPYAPGTSRIRKAVEAYNPGEASYYAKVIEHAKSFPSAEGLEASNQKIVDEANQPSSKKSIVQEVFEDLAAFAGMFALQAILLLAGAVLVVYGIMVAVRPRDRALSIPRVV
jgi:hypothetical protein